MMIHKAFKFEIMPNGAQIRRLKQFCGCSCFVFNRALDYQNKQYEADKSFKFSYNKIANLLPEWKRELTWLKDCHSQVLQQALKDLESSFKNFFAKRSDFPKFKRKGEKDSFRFPQGCKLEQQNNRIYLLKIGWIRYRNSRDVVGEIKNVTVSRKCGNLNKKHRNPKAEKSVSIWVSFVLRHFQAANILSRLTHSKTLKANWSNCKNSLSIKQNSAKIGKN